MIKGFFARLLPKGLTGQIVLVALAGLVLIQLLSIQIYRSDREEALGYVNSRNAMQRIISVVRLLSLSPPSLYHEILKASRSETLLLRLADEPLQPDNRSPRFEKLVRAKLGYPSSLSVEISAELKQDIQRSRAWQHHNRMMKDRNGMPPPQDMRLYGSIQLPNGGWLQFSSLVDKESASWSWQTTLNLLLVASLVIGLMIWLFRRATRPLKQLAANADRLGRGEDIEPLREEGPTEIRESIQAFNRMHTRLDRFVQDRTRMLAAISHDLRTPITSLRLRSEFLADGGQGAIPADPATDGADAGGDPELRPGGGAAGGDPGAGSGQPAGEPVRRLCRHGATRHLPGRGQAGLRLPRQHPAPGAAKPHRQRHQVRGRGRGVPGANRIRAADPGLRSGARHRRGPAGGGIQTLRAPR